jgi:hypothetical protein
LKEENKKFGQADFEKIDNLKLLPEEVLDTLWV